MIGIWNLKGLDKMMNTRIEKGTIFLNKTGYNIPVYKDTNIQEQTEQIEPNEAFVLISGGEIAPYSGTKCWAMTPRKEGCVVLFAYDLNGFVLVKQEESNEDNT